MREFWELFNRTPEQTKKDMQTVHKDTDSVNDNNRKRLTRNFRDKGADFEDFVPEEVLADCRKVYRRALEKAKELKPDMVLGEETGGALFAELLGKGDPDLPVKRMSKTKGKTLKDFKKELDALVKPAPGSGKKPARRFVVIDSMMGGGSAGNFRKVIPELIDQYAAEGIPLEFDMLFLRETRALEDHEDAAKAVGKYYEPNTPKIHPKMREFYFHTRWLVGDDMLPIVEKNGPSDLPVWIFGKDGQITKVWGGDGKTTAREAFLRNFWD